MKHSSNAHFILIQPIIIRITLFENDAKDRFVYALNSGRPYSMDDYRHSDTVIMFDWDGNPVSKIKLPFGVSQLTVDRLGEFIYTISSGLDGELVLSKFKIID